MDWCVYMQLTRQNFEVEPSVVWVNSSSSDLSFLVLYEIWRHSSVSFTDPLGVSQWISCQKEGRMQRDLWASSVRCTLPGVPRTDHGNCRKIASLRLLRFCVCLGVCIRIVMTEIICICVFGAPPCFECQYCACAQKMFGSHFMSKWWWLCHTL